VTVPPVPPKLATSVFPKVVQAELVPPVVAVSQLVVVVSQVPEPPSASAPVSAPSQKSGAARTGPAERAKVRTATKLAVRRNGLDWDFMVLGILGFLGFLELADLIPKNSRDADTLS
jgi:hypothetical protein